MTTLSRTEQDSIQVFAKEYFDKARLEVPLVYVAKVLSSRGAAFEAVLTKIKVDATPVRQYDPAPGDAQPRPEVLDSTSKLLQTATAETYRTSCETLMTTAINATKGGKTEGQVKQTAQRALQESAQQAVFRELERVLNASKPAIVAVYRKGGAAPPGANPATNGAAAVAPPPPNNNAPHTHPQYHAPSPPKQPAPLDAAALGASGYGQSQQPQRYQQPQQQQQYQQPVSPERAPHELFAGEDEWERYPVPEDNGPWVKVNEAFYWSESAGLYFFPAAGHFFHPDTNMWHDPEQPDRWMSEEEHEALLEKKAQMGLY